MNVRLGLVAPLFVLAGCGTQEWNLDRKGDEKAPMSITHVKAQRTTAVSLGGGSVKLDSSSPKNSVSFQLTGKVRDGYPPASNLATRAACRAGDDVWASYFVGDANTQSLVAGNDLSTYASSFMPNLFAPGPPTACEVRMRVQRGIIDPKYPEHEPIDAGRFCWTADKGLADGACAASDMPRQIPEGQLVTREVRAEWQKKDGKPGDLAVAVKMTAGKSVDPSTDVMGIAVCGDRGAAPKHSLLSIFHGLRDHEPGDTFLVQGNAFKRDDLPATPRCSIQMRVRPSVGTPPDTWPLVSTHCFADGKIAEGACAGVDVDVTQAVKPPSATSAVAPPSSADAPPSVTASASAAASVSAGPTGSATPAPAAK